MISAIKKSYNVMGATVHSPYADIILGILFYLEAIFFLPADPMLIIYCIERRERAYYYATIATIASVIGGLTSYIFGFILWKYYGNHMINHSCINYLISSETLSKAVELYRQYAWSAILIAGFTPIPYKAATLTAGFCNIPLVPFIIGSTIVRGTRFYLYAVVVSFFRVHIKESINRYCNMIVIPTFVIIVLTILYMRYR